MSCPLPSIEAKEPRFQNVKEYYSSKGYKWSDDHISRVLQMCREHYGYDADWYPETPAQFGTLTKYIRYQEVSDKLAETKSKLEGSALYDMYKTLKATFSPEQLSDRLNMLSHRFSKIVDDLVKENGGKFSRQEMINKVGTDMQSGFKRILEKAFSDYEERFSNPDKNLESWMRSNPDATEEEIEEVREEFYYYKEEYDKVLKHKDQLAYLAAAQIGENEGFVVSESDFKITFKDENSDMVDQESDYAGDEDGDSEEHDKEERYQDYRTVKLMDTLSVAAKRFISKIAKVDSQGEVMRDDLGVEQYIDGRQVAVVLKRALVNSTPETMMSDLRTESEFHPWVKGLVDKLEKDTDSQALIYNNFKSAETIYIYSTLEKGRYVPRIANTRSAGYSMMREAGTNISSGLVLDETTCITNGNGSLKSPEKISEIKKGLDELKSFLQSEEGVRNIHMVETNVSVDTSAMREFLDANPTVTHKLASYLRGIGFNVSPQDIDDIAMQTMTSKSYKFIVRNTKKGRNKLYHLVEYISNIYDAATDQKRIKTGRYLYNDNSDTFKYINRILALAKYNELESRVTVNSKSISTHNNNNLIHQIFDALSNRAELSEEDYRQMLEDEYLQFEGMALGKDNQAHGWLRMLRDQDGDYYDIRKQFRLVDQAQVTGQEYDRLTLKQKATNSLINYLDGGNLYGGGSTYSAYEVPIQADYSTAYQFVIAPHLIENEIIEELTYEVLMELERIAAIKERQADKGRAKLNVYEKQGLKLQIFPELNRNGFIDDYTNAENAEAALAIVISAVTEQMEKVVAKDFKTLEKHKILANPYIKNTGKGNDYSGLYSEDGKLDSLDEKAKQTLRLYSMNTFYARQQITKLTVGGVNQFKGVIDYEKRNMLLHAIRTSLFTEATWKGKPIGGRTKEQHVLYIGDDESRSAFYNELVEMLQVLLDQNVITPQQFKYMKSSYAKITTTDGQGLRTLDSYRALMIMSSQWSNKLEGAYRRIKEGKPKKSDIQLFLNNKKPVYTGYETVQAATGENQKPVKLTVLHKYAEQILLPLELAKYCTQANSVPFKALAAANEELKKSGNDVDMFIFSSGVKVGSHSVLAPFAKTSESDGGERVLSSVDEIRDFIVDNVKSNPNTIHKLPLKYYGISSPTPEHAANEKIAWVSQAEKQEWANCRPDDYISVRGERMKATDARDKYHKIKAADIILEFERLRKIFTNSDELERVFREEIANKSYTSSDVKYALAHLKDGSFALPLYSPNVEHQIQQTLTSIIRKRLTKPKKPGVAMLQTTSLGVDMEFSQFDETDSLDEKEKLGIVFEGSGSSKRIKYVEVYMPLIDSRLKAYADENGNINSARLNQLVEDGIIPETMLEFIAFRTPSDAEHSIIPCRIKGFTPNVEGATIRMPKEVMKMTGHDYDGDKIRCYFKHFSISDEVESDDVSIVRAILGQKPVSTLSKIVVDEYDYSKSTFENSQEARDNARVELMFSKASSSFGSRMMIIPGGCEETSVQAKSIYLTRCSRDESLRKQIISSLTGKDFGYSESQARSIASSPVLLYKTLMRLSDDYISKIVSDVASTESPFSATHALDSYESIMGGASMIGPYAVGSSAFAMFQRLNLHYVPRLTSGKSKDGKRAERKEYAVNILGCHFDKLFNMRDKAGRLGSFTLGHLVNAAVDNNKNPIISYLNQNHHNTKLTVLFAAAGMKEEDIHLLMNQPAMIELYARMDELGANSFNDASNSIIDELLEKRASEKKIFPFVSLQEISKVTEDEFIGNLSKTYDDVLNGMDMDAIEQQIYLLQTIQHLNSTANLLNDFIKLTRPEADSRAMGTSVASVILKSNELSDFRDELAASERPEISGMESVLEARKVYDGHIPDDALEQFGDELPEVVALNTFMMDNGPEMFSRLFPLAKPEWSKFANVVLGKYSRIKESDKERMLQKISEEMILWNILKDTRFVKGNPQEEQKRILVDVPKQLQKLKERIAKAELNPGTDENIEHLIGNAFLDKLTVWAPEDADTLPRIRFTINGAAIEGQRDLISASWGEMLYSYDEDAKLLAHDLFKYCIYTNGLSYGMYEFSHFAPFSVIYTMPGYLDTLRDVMDKGRIWNIKEDGSLSDEGNAFIHQYYMNHWGDNRLVNTIDLGDFLGEVKEDGSVHITGTKSESDSYKIDSLLGNSYIKAKTKDFNNIPFYRVEYGTKETPVILVPAAKLGKMNRGQQITLQYNPKMTDPRFMESVVTGNDSAWGAFNREELNFEASGNISAKGKENYPTFEQRFAKQSPFSMFVGKIGGNAISEREKFEEKAIEAVKKNEELLEREQSYNPFSMFDSPMSSSIFDGAIEEGARVGVEGFDDEGTSGNGNSMAYIARYDENGSFIEKVGVSPNSIRAARRQKVYVELNKRLRKILSEKDIATGKLTNAEMLMRLGGITDFDSATVVAEGLKELIRLKDGYEGEVALPEEFAHISLDMLGLDHPLVSRLINALKVSEAGLREAYEGQYEQYRDLYSKDENSEHKLAVEAAGKLLAKHLFRHQEIETSLIKRLVYRVADAVKAFFRKFSKDEIQNAIFDANDVASQIARGMLSGELVKIMDLGNIRSTGQFANIQRDLTGKNDILSKLLQTEVKRLSILSKRVLAAKGKPNESSAVRATGHQITKLETAIKNYKTETAVVTYLHDSLDFIAEVERSLDEAVNSGRGMNSICRKLNVVRDTLYSFSSSLQAISDAIVSGEINDTADINNAIDTIAGVLSKFHNKYERLAKSYFEAMLADVYGNEGVTVNIGRDRGRKISIHEMATKADRDISFMSRMFQAIADCDDYVLSAFDELTRSAKIRARKETNTIRHRIEDAMNKLIRETGSRDQKFIYEYEIGKDGKKHKTGKYISKEDSMKLSKAQREYFDVFMDIKHELDQYLPDTLVSDRKLIMVRKSTSDKFKEADSIGEKAGALWDKVRNDFVDMSDANDYENSEVIVDFEGNRVDMVPVKFTNKSKKESYDDMTDDAAMSLMIYAGMATEYNELNGIIGILENAKYMASEREVAQHIGNRKQRESIGYKSDGTLDSEMPAYFRKQFGVKQSHTNIQKALDDFFMMHIYGHIRKDEGTIGKTKISKRKAVDALNRLTSVGQMAINIPQRIANINTGIYNILIETASHGKVGRKFTAKDVAWASGIYVKETGDRFADIGKTDYDSKLSLWCEHFDVHQDNGQRTDKYGKKNISRVLNSGLLYLGLRVGEDYLAATTSLALARNFKVKNAEGKEETLWDAYEVKYLDKTNKSGAYLALKKGYTKLDGSEITAADEEAFQNLVAGTNFELQGIYNLDDKSAIQQYSFGALLIMYRKWIAPSLRRRYGSTYFNVRKGTFEEGYYNTAFHLLTDSFSDAKDNISAERSSEFIMRLVDDMKAYRNAISVNWNKMTAYEKSNVTRACSELGVVLGLYIACALLGKIKPPEAEDDERSAVLKWFDQTLLSNLLRLRTEIGSMAPTPMLADEAMHILKSPMASLNTIQTMINTLQMLYIPNWTTEIRSGRYKGHSKGYKYFREMPVVSMFKKIENFLDPSPLIRYYESETL